MISTFILQILIFGFYLLVDFFVFKYFIHNKKGLIQILISKFKAYKKINS